SMREIGRHAHDSTNRWLQYARVPRLGFWKGAGLRAHDVDVVELRFLSGITVGMQTTEAEVRSISTQCVCLQRAGMYARNWCPSRSGTRGCRRAAASP